MLIVRNWRTLMKTITAFTVAHSITLTFATLGWVALPSGPVEIMIAFSIVLIGAEIIRMDRPNQSHDSVAGALQFEACFFFGVMYRSRSL
ncbi:MAG: HupE/UreJ family protein [Mesorhizobium sp.]|nr:hypothetical protein EJ075_15340 [Mesorhizobium sp. M6A.T.Cr.TU.016.01.1.1]RWP41907.1 MAG: hypothetical protein EOR05_30485 [Mesorhizobium sp.]RWP47966.1 MAG: hypothetical protein EOR06_27735 [Mesorhizobium sp.]RWP69737.1 MAG: hypothetical protein EOR09_28750 [Mesorhizobium sp.]RWQ81512.1 MAG: hypothetical protein EOS85_14455 [Mesorhizobium sp.]